MVYVVIAIILLIIVFSPSKGIILFYILSPIFKSIELLGQNSFLYINAVIVFCYFIAHFNRIKQIGRNPFFFCVLLISASILISNHFGYIRHTPMAIADCLEYFSIFVVYDIFSQGSKKTLNFTIKTILFFSLIVCVNGLIEVATKQNILLMLLIKSGIYSPDTTIITEVRYGLKRAQSIFQMHTSLGGFCLITFAFLFYLKKYLNFYNKYMGLCIVMLTMCLFFTGARSAIIGFAISVMTYFNIKDLRSTKGFLGIFVLFGVLLICQNYINEIFGSIINSNNANIGSSADMRDTQFTICTYYFLQSPIIGNGISYIWETALTYDKEILGAESMWLPLMVDQGILGIVATLVIYLSMVVFLLRHRLSKYSFVVLGFLIFNSMSSIPAISEIYLLYFLIILNCARNNCNTHIYRNTTK